MAEASEDLAEAMTGINMDDLAMRWASRDGGNMGEEHAAEKPKMEFYGRHRQTAAF